METSAEHAIHGGVVRLTLPAKLAFDVGALRESLRDLAERLGHSGCATGCDVLHIGMEREFTVNQERRLAAHALSSHDEVMAPGHPVPWKSPVTVTIPERVSGNIESPRVAHTAAALGLGPRAGQHTPLMRSLTRLRGGSLMESMRTLALLFVVAAVGFPAAPSGAATNPTPPAVTFDTDFDGKVDFTIYDTNFDGVFEWPSGSKSFRGDLEVAVPVVMEGSVAITADSIAFDAPLSSAPGAPLGNLTLSARDGFGSIFITGDTDLTLTGAFKATAPSLIALDASGGGATQRITAKSISMTSLSSTVYVVNFDTDVSNPLVFLSADSISLVGKQADAGLDVEGASLAARKITLEVPAANSTFSQINVSESVLTTDPARTGRPSGDDIILSGTRSDNEVRNSVVDSGHNVVFKTWTSSTNWCLHNTAVEANGGAGIIDVNAVRGEVRLDPSEPSTLTGRISSPKKVVNADCFQ